MRVLTALFILFATVATAAANAPNVREACKGDVATLCAGIQPGGGRIRECLKANRDKVSQGCKAAIAARRAAARAAQQGQSQAPATPPAPASP